MNPPTFQVLPPEGPPPSRPSSAPRNWLGYLGVGALLVFKFGFLLLKSLKTSLSMLLMIWVYSWIFGWKFAAGFVLLLFVHEMGHVLAAKLLGMPVSAPLFIPFVGAYIQLERNPRDAWSEALMAYGGPLAGGAGGALCWALAAWYDSPLLLAIASATFVLNLFNLIPVPPLDGGRICAAVSYWFWIPGLLLLGAAVIYFHSLGSLWIILLVLVIALPRLRETLFQPHDEEMRRYFGIGLPRRLLMAALYLGLTGLLLVGYWDASSQLSYLMEDQ